MVWYVGWGGGGVAFAEIGLNWCGHHGHVVALPFPPVSTLYHHLTPTPYRYYLSPTLLFLFTFLFLFLLTFLILFLFTFLFLYTYSGGAKG